MDNSGHMPDPKYIQVIRDLKARAQAIGSECLDDTVIDLKSSEASSINNGGANEQVQYIIDSMGVEEGTKKLEEVLNG